MKKFLSLVLALVMTMSLVTISAGAKDFTDNSKITYKEAVDVMSAIKVIDGYEDGSFNPTNTLTRGAAAKIICNLILGPTTAGALSANTAPFSDVPADSVYAGYIAYCAKEGIVGGYADGTFRPGNSLTGYAFMKMLLGALGYDAAVEKYNEGNWSVAVAKRALNIGLNDGLVGEFNGTKAVTREEACLYAFNALQATMVEYNNSNTIVVGNVTVTSSSKASDVAGSTTVNYDDPNSGDGKMQFCEMYFPKLKLQATTDGYKSSSNKWTYKGVTVGSYAGSATITYTAETKASEIKADIEDYNNYDAATADVQVYKNGYNGGKIVANEDNIKALTGNGTVVELYVSDNGITKIVVKEAVVGKVTAVSKKNETVTIASEASASGTFGEASTTWTTGKGYGDVAVDDYVLVMAYNTSSNSASGATVTKVSKLEKVEGLATKKNASKETITMDGTVYEAAEAIVASKNVASFGVSSKYDATLYVDSYGYVVYAKGGSASTSDTAVAVLDSYQSLNKDGKLVYMVKGVTSNGETVVWEAAADYSTYKNKVRLYSESDDVYTVAADGAVNTASTNMADGSTSVGFNCSEIKATDKSYTTGHGQKLYFADDVKFIYVNNGKAVVKDGVQKVAAGTGMWIVTEEIDDEICISAVYVAGTVANTSVSEKDVVFVDASSKTANGYSLTDKDNKVQTYYTYDAYVAGEKLDLFYTKTNVTVDGFYTVEIDEDDGNYVLTNNEITTGDNGELSVSAEETYTKLYKNTLSGTNDYKIANATFVDVTGNDYTSFSEVKADIDDAGNTAVDGAKFMVIYDYDTGVASYVYLTAIINN